MCGLTQKSCHATYHANERQKTKKIIKETEGVLFAE
jgi:hypothetical protein